MVPDNHMYTVHTIGKWLLPDMHIHTVQVAVVLSMIRHIQVDVIRDVRELNLLSAGALHQVNSSQHQHTD